MSAPKLAGKVALVTGAGRGLGRTIAAALAAEGAAIAVNYRASRDGAEAVVADIVGLGGTAIALQADVAEFDQAQRLVAQAIDRLGGLHILVNNAGVTKDGLIATMAPSDWMDVMRVNFGGVFNCTQAAIDHLMREREGVIVNVSSVMGERAWIGTSGYAASKAAVNAFTRCAAMELARFGIRVNAVLPGFVPTEMVAGLMRKDEGRGLLQQIPMRSFATPEDVARAVVFLAGPDSGYTTGSTLVLDGGVSGSLGLGRPL